MSEEFRPVTRKKWLAYKNTKRQPKRERRISDRLGPSDMDAPTFLKRLENCCAQLATSDYYVLALATLERSLEALDATSEDVKRIVCFGLGPFTRTYQSLHQFAFILNLQRNFKLNCIYYDPQFNKTEREVLQLLEDCQLMTTNCEAKYEADVLTLFYLPHCPLALANNLLWCNWRVDRLPNVVLINNSFEHIVSNTLERVLRDDTSYVWHIRNYTKEYALENDYEPNTIFNDLSIHVFPLKKLPSQDSQFWLERKDEAPVYVDLTFDELIAAEMEKLSISS